MACPSATPARALLSCLALHVYTIAQKHRLAAGLVCAALWGCVLAGIPALRMDNSITAFFPDHAPAMRTLARGMDISPLAHCVSVDLYTPDGDAADLAAAARDVEARIPAQLARPLRTDTLAQGPQVPPQALFALLPSLCDTAMLHTLEASLTPGALARAVDKAYATLAGFSTAAVVPWLRTDPLEWRTLLTDKLPHGALPAADPRYGYPVRVNTTADESGGTHMLLLFTPVHSMKDAHASLALMQVMEETLTHLPTGIQATVVGGIRHTAANTQAINNDITWIGTLSLLGLVLVYALLVRSWGAVWLFMTPLLAVGASLGVIGLSMGMVSGLALGFGAAVLGIAEDYAVHTHFALRTQPDRRRVFGALASPLFQGLLLNATGFTVLLFSAIPAIRQLALFALLALCAGFTLALFVLPWCPGFDGPPLAASTGAGVAPPAATRPPRLPRLLPTLLAVLTLTGTCYGLFIHLPMNTSPQNMGADAQAILRDTQNFARVWQRDNAQYILVEQENTDDALTANARILRNLRTLLPNARLMGSADILPPAAVAQANCQRWNAFMHTHAATVEQALSSAATAHGLPGDFFAPFAQALRTTATPVSPAALHNTPQWGLQEAANARVRSFPAHDGTAEVVQTLIISQTPLESVPATALTDAIAGGVLMGPYTLENALREVFAREGLYIPCTLLLCAVLLFASFRNVRQTFLAMLPPLAALCAILLGMWCTGQTLTIAGLAALPLVFGLAVDHGIMVTHDLANGVRLGIERAVIVSSLTACVGMGLLAFATHPALRAMGQVIFWGLAIEVPASLWLLPLFCKEHA